ncbi:MAG: hypothetical protein HXX11_15775 [Desulfuromonadales bacterium]|nr:hypothetical protein [Desulfuromonadales bacterium]
MKNYVNDTNQDVVAASPVLEGTVQYLSTVGNPDLPFGTILREKDNPDSPHLRITAVTTMSDGGAWLTPVEMIKNEYRIKYSFITFTHSTIAGSMPQEAATKAEAIALARDWLVRVYQPVEFDYVTVEEP